jgi:hypothetical protein
LVAIASTVFQEFEPGSATRTSAVALRDLTGAVTLEKQPDVGKQLSAGEDREPAIACLRGS